MVNKVNCEICDLTRKHRRQAYFEMAFITKPQDKDKHLICEDHIKVMQAISELWQLGWYCQPLP